MKNKRVISPAEKQNAVVMTRPRRGFCINNEGRERLIAWGLTRLEIYQDGQLGENITRCMNWFREPGDIVLADDLRIFGKSRKAIFAFTKEIHGRKLGLIDITGPVDDNNISAMEERAWTAISAQRFTDDPRGAKRAGRLGGKGKAIAAAARRAAIMSDDIIREICIAPELTWARRLQILKYMASRATLYRRYVAQQS